MIHDQNLPKAHSQFRIPKNRMQIVLESDMAARGKKVLSRVQ